MDARQATVARKTRETDITITLALDGSGHCACETGIAFLDHMLDGFARHGLFDLTARCVGDLAVDCHHTAEDVGIVLGEALRRALGEKQGIKRYGSFALPMDDALILCAIDLSGRPYYCSDVAYTTPNLGGLATEMIGDFFYALSYSAGMNLHFSALRGSNNHHLAEASFKAFAKALDMASALEPRVPGVWSTKGSL